MDEAKLLERLRRIEALHAGATTEGERAAAAHAREQIKARLAKAQAQETPIEYRFSMADLWSRKVFIALLRRYGLNPYRFHGQRHTTVMVMAPESFVEETLWPEFEAISETLRAYLSEVTERVITEVIYPTSDEAEVVPKGGRPALVAPAEDEAGRGEKRKRRG